MIKLSEFKIDKKDFFTSDKILNFVNNLNNDNIEYIKTDFIKRRNKNIITLQN